MTVSSEGLISNFYLIYIRGAIVTLLQNTFQA